MIPSTPLSHLHAIELPTPFAVGPITVYLGDAPGEPLTLVDTGPRIDDARLALESGLASLGYTMSDLDCIVVTHAHVDHFGLAGHLAAVSESRVLTHPWNIAALGDFDSDRLLRETFYANLLRQAAVPEEIIRVVGMATGGMKEYAHPVGVDTTLDEGDILPLAGCHWQVLHTPGHARGLICLYEPGSRTLLSSDHLLANVSSNPVVEPPLPGQFERPRSLALYRDSMQRVATLGVNMALPSHGPFIHDVAGLVRRRLAFHQRRLTRVFDVLQNGAETTWDITQALFSNRTPMDTFLAVSEVIGHLDLLELDGRIEAREVGGVIYWEIV